MLFVIIPIALFVIIRPYGIKRSRGGTEKDDDYLDFLKKKHKELENHDNTQ